MIMILQFFNNFKHITCLLIEYLKFSLFTVIRHLFVSLLTDRMMRDESKQFRELDWP